MKHLKSTGSRSIEVKNISAIDPDKKLPSTLCIDIPDEIDTNIDIVDLIEETLYKKFGISGAHYSYGPLEGCKLYNLYCNQRGTTFPAHCEPVIFFDLVEVRDQLLYYHSDNLSDDDKAELEELQRNGDLHLKNLLERFDWQLKEFVGGNITD